jgi:signal transduction histidine kinase
LRKLLDLHERDRQLVAYEIHDGMAQEMAAAVMHFQAFQHTATEMPEWKEFERGLNLLREAVQEARRLISGLRPPVLDEFGVITAIEYLVNEFRSEVPDIRFVHHTKFGRLAAPLESAIFRVVQEALSNIRRHSGSRRAKIELFEHGQQVRLVVRDWGKGFDPAKVREGSFGLQGIQQRGRLLGGKASIESRPGQGTTVVVDFPLILDRSETDAAGRAEEGS